MAALESTQYLVSADCIIGNPLVQPEALLRLELLLSQRVVDLAAVTEIVASDRGLSAMAFQLTHETGEALPAFPRIAECIVVIGVEGLRECLRRAEPQLAAEPAE